MGWMLVGMVIGTVARGQTQPPPSEPGDLVNPLVAKQQMIRDRLARLEDRMFRLREQLLDEEPENAARLADALEEAGALGVQDRVELLIRLLGDSAQLSKASDEQEALMGTLQSLLKTLTEKSTDDEARQEEIARLEEFKARISELRDRQHDLRDDTAKTSQSERRARQLAEAIKRVDELIRRQTELNQSGQPGQGAEAGQAASQEQGEVSKATKRLSEDLRRMDVSPSDSDTESTEGDPGHSADDESSSEGGTPAESGNSQSGQSGQSSPSGGPSQSSQSDGALPEAADELDGAKDNMDRASDALSEQKQNEARSNQVDALEKLRRARDKLEQAKKQLEKTDNIDRLAKGQKDVARDAQQLGRQMKQGPKESQGGQQGGQSGQQGGQQGQQGQQGESQQGEQGDSNPEQQQSKQTPGQQQVERAQQHMEGAAEDLEQSESREATEDQDNALEQLDDALAELEEALRQLRQEEQEEILRDLESRFKAILADQRGINSGTLEVHAVGVENFSRAERLQTAELSDDQTQVARDVAVCLHVLEEEGTTVVFPAVLEHIESDMHEVARRLNDLQVGALTQAIQKEIVTTLEHLVEAVEKQQEQMSQQGQSGQPSPQQGDQPLLPTSAELKLLKAMQVGVNERTAVIHDEATTASETRESIERAIKGVAERQKEASTIAAEMRDLESGS